MWKINIVMDSADHIHAVILQKFFNSFFVKHRVFGTFSVTIEESIIMMDRYRNLCTKQ